MMIYCWLNCPKCYREKGVYESHFQYTDINNQFISEFTCEKGHTTFFWYYPPKFDLFFQLGMLSIIDKNPNAAILYFANSLEEFFKFCIKLFSIPEIDHNLNEENEKNILFKIFDNIIEIKENVIKPLKYSERIYDAFYALYFKALNEPPRGYKKFRKQTELRNNIIHEGYIPTINKIIKYGKFCQNLIISSIKKILSKYPEKYIAVSRFGHRRNDSIADKLAKNKGEVSGYPLCTFLDTFQLFLSHNYKFCILENDQKIESHKFYIAKEDNNLKYKVICLQGEDVEGKIPIGKLKASFSEPFALEEIIPYFSDILKITAQLGHTDPYIKTDIKAKIDEFKNNPDQRSVGTLGSTPSNHYTNYSI